MENRAMGSVHKETSDVSEIGNANAKVDIEKDIKPKKENTVQDVSPVESVKKPGTPGTETYENETKVDDVEKIVGQKAGFPDLFRTPNLRKKTLIIYFSW